MLKLNFENPENWNITAMAMLYEPSEEYYDEVVHYIYEGVEESNNVQTGLVIYSAADCYKLARAANPDSRFSTRGTCDHCGAHFHYGAIYENAETNQVAVIGHTCASNKLNLDTKGYKKDKLQQIAKRAKTKAKADMRESHLSSYRRQALKTDNHIVKDIKSKFREYGSLSFKQWDLVKKIYLQNSVKVFDLNAKPVTEGRVKIFGEIVSVKVIDTDWGMVTKILVKDERGFKVYGSLPTSAYDADRGDKIEFTATVEKSKDDEYFGFYKRPAKAKIQLSA